MTTTDCATDIPALPSENSQDAPQSFPREGSKPLKGLLWGFGATVTIGLTLASWYVGVRIVAADEVAPANSASAQVVPVEAPATVQAVATVEAAAPPANLYLQMAGLGTKQDAGFVKTLQAKGFQAQVQGGDRADNARILIGPFATHFDLEQAQRKLQSLGVLAIETAR
jgi:hypothetical protein